MIAMQYRFRLPTDYDMGIITTRVRENGHRLDGFPGLILKAWCYASRNDPHTGSEPLYAPFYLWQDSASMADFLQSAGFQRLVADFGRPPIDCWPVLEYHPGSQLTQTAFACREITPVTENSALSLPEKATADTDDVTHILAWDVQRWQRLHLRLSERPFAEAAEAERYRVGHLSLPVV